MSQTIHVWHQRFVQQTRWTQAIARHLFQRIQLDKSSLILEVGCGTGAVLQELLQLVRSRYFGLDINPDYLSYFSHQQPQSRLILGDAHYLPLGDASCDVCLCHFLLLWVKDPSSVVREMCRVTRTGGVVMAIAEPDYGGRIDYPSELSQLGKWQMESLRHQGANPTIGRKLRALLSNCGLADVEAGVLGGEWNSSFDPQEFNSEWETLQSDLANDPLKLAQMPPLKQMDLQSSAQGERILFTPTFYAWGTVR